MKLPEAIQRQVDEAEALERQLYSQPSNGNENAGDITAATPAVEPKMPETQTDEVIPQPEIKAKPGREDDAEYWRSRASTLYGVNQQQAADLQQLKGQVQALTEQLASVRQAPQPEVTPPKDNDAETFGEDLVEMADRRATQKARELVAQETAALRDYIARLESKLGTVGEQVAVSAQDRFYSELAKLVPDYESVNAEQGFLAWLGEVDPVYQVPRQVALDNAANALDPNRTAAVFNAYKSLSAVAVQQQNTQQNRRELERQTAPTSTKGAAPQPTQGKVWTVQDYERALDPRNISVMGRQRADALAAEAEQAYAEGRVQF